MSKDITKPRVLSFHKVQAAAPSYTVYSITCTCVYFFSHMFGDLCSMVVTKYPASCNVFLLGHTLHMHVNREVDKELWRSMARLERMKLMEFSLINWSLY